MQFLQGDIFDKKNITFKETGKMDLRLNGHPVLVPIDIDFHDDYYYYFTIGSQIHLYSLEPDRFYLLPKGNGTGLTKSSLVDLKHIYRQRKQSHNVRGSIGENESKKLLNKFNEYADKNIDEDCDCFIEIIPK